MAADGGKGLPFAVESDCPEFSDYFDSDVLIIRKNVTSAQLSKPDHLCWKWPITVDKTDMKEAFQLKDHPSTTSFVDFHLKFGAPSPLAEPGVEQEAIIACDRQFLQWFQSNPSLVKDFHQRYKIPIYRKNGKTEAFPEFGALGDGTAISYKSLSANSEGLHPMVLFGCLFDAILQFKPFISSDVATTMKTGVPPSTGPILGIQLRRGGTGVKWKDPSRIAKKDVMPFMSCVGKLLQKSSASSQVYVTSDSAKAMGQLLSVIPRDRSIIKPYQQGIYFHTGLSKGNNVVAERKVVVDMASLMACDQLWITRSGFSEVPAWVAMSRRPQSFRFLLIRAACGVNKDLECSTDDC